MQKIRSVWDSILQLVYPDHAVCMGCGDLAGTQEGWLCPECEEAMEELKMEDREICPRCGMERKGGRCRNCEDWPDDAVQIARYCYGYAYPIDACVMKMKYTGVYRMTEWMGERMAELLEQGAFGRIDLLVPVPMHPSRLRERGRNHAQCLAEEISRINGVPVFNGLGRSVNTKQQARLKGDERRRALQGAFSLDTDAGQIAGKRIVLIDDVITTGTTVNSCAKILYANGAERVCAAAFAGHLSAAENTVRNRSGKDYAK
ncbi:MAG: ComF family protein [Clostridia bacterium]|nr:ComF family protein [Clostridia bacterium]